MRRSTATVSVAKWSAVSKANGIKSNPTPLQLLYSFFDRGLFHLIYYRQVYRRLLSHYHVFLGIREFLKHDSRRSAQSKSTNTTLSAQRYHVNETIFFIGIEYFGNPSRVHAHIDLVGFADDSFKTGTAAGESRLTATV